MTVRVIGNRCAHRAVWPSVEALALEVRAVWGVSTLGVSFTSPPKSFSMAGSAGPLVDVVEGTVSILLPRDGEGTLTTERETFALRDLVSADAARPFRASPTGAGRRVVLPVGAHARVEWDGLVFEIALLRVSDLCLETAAKPPRSRHAVRSMAFSFAMHVGILGGVAYHMPALAPDEAETADREQLPRLWTRIDTPAEDEPVVDEDDDEGDLCRHHGVGVPGTTTTHDKTKHRYGVSGPIDNPDPHVARTLAEGRWSPYFFATIVPIPISGDRKAYTMPWGRDDALGNDASSARGRIWGDLIGDVYGYAALGARPPHVDPPEEEDEDDDDSLVGLIPSTVGRGTGFVPTSFDAALWAHDAGRSPDASEE